MDKYIFEFPNWIFYFRSLWHSPAAKMSFALMSKKGREERHMKELRDAFDAADKDKDGKLSPHEWLQVLKITGVDANW